MFGWMKRPEVRLAVLSRNVMMASGSEGDVCMID
jgi:hypothetical protein